MVQKLHVCKKVYFDQLLDFPISLLLFLHTIIVPYFTLWMLDLFQYYPGVKHFGSRSGPTFCRPDLGPNRLQRLSADMAGKELITKQLVDAFWLKPWLKLISFGSNFFHLAKVLATTNYEPG